MIAHWQAIKAIEAEYPQLVGQNSKLFFVGHPMDGEVQSGPAFVAAWDVPDIECPTPEELEALFIKHFPEGMPAMQEWPKFYGNAKLGLFTQAEQLAVVTATMSDPVVKLMYDRLLGAAFLSYEDQETEQGLSLLCSKGLLTQERKAEIVRLMQPSEKTKL